MNVPAVAKKSFHELQGRKEFLTIVQDVLKRLRKTPNDIKRARFVHKLIDQFNQEVFSNPIVQEMSPCKAGCSMCCHTQVSVTEDEARLLVMRINEGTSIDESLLEKQMAVGNDDFKFFSLSYEERRCIFLNDLGQCKVYEDRPSVCRTNAVLGAADQCDTKSGVRPVRLVKTEKADMVIYASFLSSQTSGTLPSLVGKLLTAEEDSSCA